MDRLRASFPHLARVSLDRLLSIPRLFFVVNKSFPSRLHDPLFLLFPASFHFDFRLFRVSELWLWLSMVSLWSHLPVRVDLPPTSLLLVIALFRLFVVCLGCAIRRQLYAWSRHQRHLARTSYSYSRMGRSRRLRSIHTHLQLFLGQVRKLDE